MLHNLIYLAFEVYMILILVRIVLSWIKHNPYQPIIRFVYEITEPFLSFFRKIIPPIGMMDISPVVAYFVLLLIRTVLLSLI